MTRTSTSILKVLAIVAALAICGAIVIPVFASARVAHGSLCLYRLKVTSLALSQYASDYDDRLPIAATWADATLPFVKGEEFFRCSEVGPLGFGHAFYKAMSQRPLADIRDPGLTPWLFESTDLRWNAASDFSTLTPGSRHDSGKIAIACADGRAVFWSREHLVAIFAHSRHWSGWGKAQ